MVDRKGQAAFTDPKGTRDPLRGFDVDNRRIVDRRVAEGDNAAYHTMRIKQNRIQGGMMLFVESVPWDEHCKLGWDAWFYATCQAFSDATKPTAPWGEEESETEENTGRPIRELTDAVRGNRFHKRGKAVERAFEFAVQRNLPGPPPVKRGPIPARFTQFMKDMERADLEFYMGSGVKPITFDTTAINPLAKSRLDKGLTPRRGMNLEYIDKIKRYRMAYADFRPYVVTLLGTPCPRSRKRLTHMCHQACSVAIAGPWAMGPEDANQRAGKIIQQVAFATVKAVAYWAFRGPEGESQGVASADCPGTTC